MMIESNEVTKFLISLLDNVKAKSRLGNTAVAKAYFNSKIEILEQLIIFLVDLNKKDDTAMEKLKMKLAYSIVSLNEIPKRQRHSELEEYIITLASKLSEAVEEAKKKNKDLPALYIEDMPVKGNHFRTKIYHLKKNWKTRLINRSYSSGGKILPRKG